MAQAVADLFVILDSVTDPFSAGMKKAAAEAESQSHRMSAALGTVTKVGLGVGAAALGIGTASVKAATDFQASMTKLSTQAGVSQAKVADLSKGVLDLAGQVGFSPNSLAQSLYHVESNFESMGISSQQALNLVKIAAEGAAVGGADLVDVTNALTAAVASGIPGVQDMSGAMGMLNKIVGVGDMSMQDLADAFGTGMLATVKGFGVTLADVGAGLATFGDNNIRGAAAGTEFRMAIQALAKPAATAGDVLAKLGLKTDTLAKDMQHGGLKQALIDLEDHMNKAGIKANQQGEIITEAFGKKAGTGINILIGQFDRVMSKYPGMDSGASGFTAAWDQTKNTFAQQMKDIGAGVDALGVRIGLYLIPQVSKLITLGQTDIGQIVAGFTGKDHPAPTHAGMHNAFLNKDVTAPPDVTGWQRFGEEVRTALGDVEQAAKRLEPVGMDFVRFGEDVWQALGKIEPVAMAVGHDLGVGLFLGAKAAGTVFKDVLGPGIKDVADFIDAHQTAIRIFADVVLGSLALKMGVLGTINAAKGLIGLATSIVQFPISQTNEIKTAWQGMTNAWTGTAAKDGEQAVQGLAGAFGDLRTKASGALDKVLPDSAQLAGLAQLGVNAQTAGMQAKAAGEQLSLFETSESGVVQVAEQGPQQLALFEAGVGNVATEAANSEKAVSGLSGAMGKLALAGGVVGAALVGVQLLSDEMNHLFKIGQATAQSVDDFTKQLQLSANGSSEASSAFTRTAVQAALSSHLVGQSTTQMKNMDQALAQMVSSGDGQAARAQFNDIAQALQNQGFNAQATAAEFPQYEKALKDAGTAADTLSGQIDNSLSVMQRQQGLSQFTSDLSNLTQQIKDNGGALSGNSQMAQQNVNAFRDMAVQSLQFYQQEINSHVPMATAAQDLQNQYFALEGVATQFLGSKQAADNFLKSLGMIQPSYDIAINLNVGAAYQQLNGLIQKIDTSTGVVQITGTYGGVTAGGKALTYDSGGVVPGPMGAPRVAVVHGGEVVLSNEQLSGRSALSAQMLTRFGSGSSSYVPGHGGGAVTVVNHNITVNVAGSVTTEAKLVETVRTQVLQYKLRNSSNGWG